MGKIIRREIRILMSERELYSIAAVARIMKESHMKISRAFKQEACSPRLFMSLRKLFGEGLKPEYIWNFEEGKEEESI